MKAEIIAIGTELLLGHIVNTNTAYLGRKLAEVGIDVYYHTTVGDNPSRLAEAVTRALGRSDIVVTTGGLGPTVDDITAEAITKFNGRKLILRNKVGTAPGLIIEHRDKVIACLPGPPRELEHMFEKDVIPYLKKKYKFQAVIKSRTIKTTGLAESQVNKIVKDLLKIPPPTTVGIYVKHGEVDLRIMSKAKDEAKTKKAISKIERIIKKRLKNYIFGYDDETLEGTVAKILTKRRLTIATAESCTGGILSDRLTNISGSSKYFICGVIAYSNESKTNMLGVSENSIKKHGAVSAEVALEMVKGIKHFACVDIGIAITGIAGPTGATKTKPIGMVYVALVTDRKRVVREFRFKGSRKEIKFQSSQVALDMIRKLCGRS